MIKISKMADYATVIMAYLARTNSQATAREIADATHIAWPTVCKILKLLVKNDLLTSARGAHGGYGLARAANAISLGEILVAMEENVSMTECSGDHSSCDKQAQCQVSGHWRAISSVIDHALAGYTVADLLAPSENITMLVGTHD